MVKPILIAHMLHVSGVFIEQYVRQQMKNRQSTVRIAPQVHSTNTGDGHMEQALEQPEQRTVSSP